MPAPSPHQFSPFFSREFLPFLLFFHLFTFPIFFFHPPVCAHCTLMVLWSSEVIVREFPMSYHGYSLFLFPLLLFRVIRC